MDSSRKMGIQQPLRDVTNQRRIGVQSSLYRTDEGPSRVVPEQLALLRVSLALSRFDMGIRLDGPKAIGLKPPKRVFWVIRLARRPKLSKQFAHILGDVGK